MADSTAPAQYVNAATMTDAGYSQVACRVCRNPRWWVWRREADLTSAIVVFVCQHCGHISQRFLLSALDGGMVDQPVAAPE